MQYDFLISDKLFDTYHSKVYFKDSRIIDLYEEVRAKEKIREKIYNIDLIKDLDESVYIGFGKNDAGPGGWCMIDKVHRKQVCYVRHYHTLWVLQRLFTG